VFIQNKGSTNPSSLANAQSADHVVYTVVAARRLQWDNLIWQVPLLSLTAQAFLFTIALGGDSRQASRIVACLLSLVVTYVTTTLMARHRQAEIHDARWLEHYEQAHWPRRQSVHGLPFQQSRNAVVVDGGWADRFVPLVPGYKTWIGGLMLFGAAALVVLGITIVNPGLLRG
jgi:hypothetical protein